MAAIQDIELELQFFVDYIATTRDELARMIEQRASSNGTPIGRIVASELRDTWADQLVISFEAHIYGHVIKELEVEFPNDWWQAFKDRWFPGWAKRRWPVKFDRHYWKVVDLYPKSTPGLLVNREKPVRYVSQRVAFNAESPSVVKG